MNSATKPSGAAAKDSPLDQFSQCHVGIMSKLHDLEHLPALAESAAQARRTAAALLDFFRDVIYTHHAEEEKDLFPAVLRSAVEGDERNRVREIVERLTREHRQAEATWTQVEPVLKDIAKGRNTILDAAKVQALVKLYQAHAAYEEQEFLPLSQTILMRDSNHMSALGLSLHMRHALPEALARFPGRI